MKTTRRTILATSILALISTSAFAQTWTGGGDGISWNDPLNWNVLPVSGPATSVFFNNGASLTTNQNLGNPFVFNQINQTTASAFLLGGNPIQMGGAGSYISIAGVNSVISAPLIIAPLMNGVFCSTMTISGGVSGSGPLNTFGQMTLSGPGTWTGGTSVSSGTLFISAANALPTSGDVALGGILEFSAPTAVAVSGNLSGNGTLRQSGPGSVTLSGNSSGYFGSVIVAAGTLQTGGGSFALGNGPVTVQSGGTLNIASTTAHAANSVTVQSGGLLLAGASGGFQSSQIFVQSGGLAQLTANGGLTGAGGMNVAAGATLDAAGFQQTTGVTINNSGTVSLPLGSDVTVGGFSTWTGVSSGAGVLRFNGFTDLNAGTSLTHTGGTQQIGGQTQFYTSNSLPDSGQLRISGGNLYHYATDTVDTILVDGGNLAATTLTATGSVNLQSGSLTGTSVTINGAFTKTTAGTATLGTTGGNVTMAAGGTVSAGLLNVGGALNGALVNNASVVTLFNAGAVSGPVTNNGTFDINGASSLNGATTNAGTITLIGGNLNGTVANTGTIASLGGIVAADVSGPGNFTATGASTTLAGINSYTGGSVTVGSNTNGTTDSIQGAWTLTNSQLLFTQATPGTMAGNISGVGGMVILNGTGLITLSGSNTYDGGVTVYAVGGHLGFGSNTAAGIGGPIQSIGNTPAFKLSAQGGARVVANPLIFSNTQTEFTGANNLTFTNAAPKTLSGVSDLLHTSTAITSIAGTFLGQNTTSINVNAGTLILGAAVNNGFRMDGAINVASGATLQMISNSPVKLGPTNLNGGTLIAANGVAVPTGLALTATGVIQGRVSSEAGSLIEATGALTIGDASSFGGFFSNGELREMAQGVTLLDKNQAVLGSLTEVGTNVLPGLLTAANGVFVDFGRAITGYGIVAGNNVLADATIMNGDAEGNSNVQPLDFTGYVKGLGTFTDVVFSGTFSPGLSPAIVPVNNVSFGPGSTFLAEIGGLTPGSQHDQLDIGGTLGLNGLLDVDLINGFNPASGNVFNILDGVTSGTFSSFSFPSLSPGLAWDTSDLYTQGDLKIVPEPSAALLLFAGLGALLRRRR